jgi:hypothetical protein
MMLFHFRQRATAWIVGLASRCAPTAGDGETGVLVPVDITLDRVGDDALVAMRRRRGEDCRSYRLRLQVFLQEQVMVGEHCNHLLAQLLDSERCS